MMFIKRTVSFSYVALSVFIVSACGNGKSDVKEASSTTAPSAALKTDEPADLVVFGNPADPENVFNARIGDAARKKFPNYKITYLPRTKDTTMDSLIASGAQLDLIYDSVPGAMGSVVNSGAKYDITELAKKHQIDLNRFDPGQLDAAKSLGGLYGLPIQTGGLVMYINKDIFDKFGVSYPKNGMTWDEAIELGKKLTRKEGDTQYIGLGLSINHAFIMNALSAPFVDTKSDKAALNNDTFKKLVDTLVMKPTEAPGYKEYIASIKRTFNNNDFMKDRTLAMFIMNYGLQDQDFFKEFNWDMAPLPVFKDNPGVGTQAYPALLLVNTASKNKDQSMELMKFLTSDEYQMDLSKRGFVPVVKDEKIRKAFASDLSQYKDKNVVNALFYNKTAPSAPKSLYDSPTTSALSKQYVPLITGQIDINSALRAADEEANKAIETAKSQKK